MKFRVPAAIAAVLFTSSLLFPAMSRAHCDGMDGPVVTLAAKALDAGSVNLVLPWVRDADEPAIRAAFEHTLAVRKLGPDAKHLADTYFFETLVRVHRAGEGAPYTGLKPAGRDLGPAVPAADKALASGSPAQVEKLLTDAVRNGLHQHYEAAATRTNYAPDDVAAGRRYVEAYVPYVHYVEGIWEAAANPGQGHETDTATHAH
ncbi:MAG: DUF6448 family protein [Gemmatimonadota bacterium]